MPRWSTVAVVVLALVVSCGKKVEDAEKEAEANRALAKEAFKAFTEVENSCEAAEDARVEFTATGKKSFLTRQEREIENAKNGGAALYRTNEVFAQLVDEVQENLGGEAVPADGSLDYCDSKYAVVLHNRLMKFR